MWPSPGVLGRKLGSYISAKIKSNRSTETRWQRIMHKCAPKKSNDETSETEWDTKHGNRKRYNGQVFKVSFLNVLDVSYSLSWSVTTRVFVCVLVVFSSRPWDFQFPAIVWSRFRLLSEDLPSWSLLAVRSGRFPTCLFGMHLYACAAAFQFVLFGISFSRLVFKKLPSILLTLFDLSANWQLEPFGF